MKRAPAWLDRRVSAPGPYLALCLSEREFRKVIRRLKHHGEHVEWVKRPSDARMYTFPHYKDGSPVCVVGLRSTKGRSAVEIAGLLVHEAVHVWQEYREHINERYPAAEQEAYGIQSIAQELLAEYARRASGEK